MITTVDSKGYYRNSHSPDRENPKIKKLLKSYLKSSKDFTVFEIECAITLLREEVYNGVYDKRF